MSNKPMIETNSELLRTAIYTDIDAECSPCGASALSVEKAVDSVMATIAPFLAKPERKLMPSNNQPDELWGVSLWKKHREEYKSGISHYEFTAIACAVIGAATKSEWQKLFDRVAGKLKCLPSAFVQDNEHVIAAAEKAMKRESGSLTESQNKEIDEVVGGLIGLADSDCNGSYMIRCAANLIERFRPK